MRRGGALPVHAGAMVGTLIAVLALAACGSDESSDADAGDAKTEIKQVVAGYQDDFLARDADGVCDRLTAAGQREVVAYGQSIGFVTGPSSCVRVVRIMSRGAAKIEQQRSKVLKIDVQGDRAIAMVSDAGRPAEPTELRKVAGVWKLQDSGLKNPLEGP